MLVAAMQFDIAWEQKSTNRATVERSLVAANVPPGSLVVLPELAETGFSMNLECIVDDFSLPWAIGVAQRFGIYVQHGFARVTGQSPRGRNVAAVVDPSGSVIADYEKIHPFSYGQESDHFSGGNHLSLCRVHDAVVCPLVCYDLRFPEIWRMAALAGAEVFTIGANWPAARQHHWRSLIIARAIENQAYVVATNRIGSDPQVAYAGGSMMVSPQGEIIADAEDRSGLLLSTIDLESLRAWRDRFPALRDVRRPHLGSIRLELPILHT